MSDPEFKELKGIKSISFTRKGVSPEDVHKINEYPVEYAISIKDWAKLSLMQENALKMEENRLFLEEMMGANKGQPGRYYFGQSSNKKPPGFLRMRRPI